MMAKNPSGLALLNQRDPLGKNTTNPEWTKQFLDNIDYSHFEGKEPIKGEHSIIHYKGLSYKITKEGKLKSLS